MNHVITNRDVLHGSLLGLFLFSLIGVVFFWFYAFAQGMSDAPTEAPSLTMMILVHVLPIVLFAGWWFT